LFVSDARIRDGRISPFNNLKGGPEVAKKKAAKKKVAKKKAAKRK
jgi:hypothetical protein